MKTISDAHGTLEHVKHLSVHIGSRPIGSTANLAAADYISEVFKKAGLILEKQEFSCPDWIEEHSSLELTRFTNPPLTTISQPKKEVGAQAVNLLVDRISQKSRPPSRLVLAPELIIRRSTKEVDQFMASSAPGLNPAVPAAVDAPD